ncbi:hypothetical protein [Desulfosporosinus fructosivorans]
MTNKTPAIILPGFYVILFNAYVAAVIWQLLRPGQKVINERWIGFKIDPSLIDEDTD